MECTHCLNVHSEEECDVLNCKVIQTIREKNNNSKVKKKETCKNKWSAQPWAIHDCAPAREDGMGMGLKAISPIQGGVVIAPYIGKYSRGIRKGNYTMSGGGVTIDAKTTGNNTRFINQCCKNRAPNCAAKQRKVFGQETFWIVSIKEIEPGEFLSYDYDPSGQTCNTKWNKLKLDCGCALCSARE